jgi:molecular chaperone DnaK
MAADNKVLGNFTLDGLPPAPRGVPQIEVTFDLDADGILHVNAQDKATGREQKITITASSGLSEAEVKRMVEEAERHRAEDEQRKEGVETRNHADSLVHAAEKALRDAGDKVPGNVKSDVEAKIQAVRDALGGSDVALVKRRADELGSAIQQIGASMYQQQPGAAPGPDQATGQAGTGGPSGDEVVEGEFQEA